jgi:hypothetical protein
MLDKVIASPKPLLAREASFQLLSLCRSIAGGVFDVLADLLENDSCRFFAEEPNMKEEAAEKRVAFMVG